MLEAEFGGSQDNPGLDNSENREYTTAEHAGIAQLVEHHLAKVRVAGSSPVSRFFLSPLPFTPSSKQSVEGFVLDIPDFHIYDSSKKGGEWIEMKSMPSGIAVLKWYLIIIGILSIAAGAILPPFAVGILKLVMEVSGEELAPIALVGGMAFLYGFLVIGWGILHVFVGLYLGKGHGWAKIAALIIGTISILSGGAILGILCLFIYLLSEECKAFFQTQTEGR